MHYRQVEFVLRYHAPIKVKQPENYAHRLLFTFYPFRDKCELKLGQPPSYSSKLNEPGVLDTVNYNKSLVEPYSYLIDAAFLNYRSDIMPSWDPFSQQENENVEDEVHEIELIEQTETDCSDETQSSLNYPERSFRFHVPILSDYKINGKIRPLNLKQRQIFDFIHNRAKLHIKVKSGTTKKQSTLFHSCLWGSGGCGKSHLNQTVFHAVRKVFLY